METGAELRVVTPPEGVICAVCDLSSCNREMHDMTSDVTQNMTSGQVILKMTSDKVTHRMTSGLVTQNITSDRVIQNMTSDKVTQNI